MSGYIQQTKGGRMKALLFSIPMLDTVNGTETASRDLFFEGHNVLVSLDADNVVTTNIVENPLEFKGARLVAEVEVPDEVLELVLRLVWAKNSLNSKYSLIKALTEDKTQ